MLSLPPLRQRTFQTIRALTTQQTLSLLHGLGEEGVVPAKTPGIIPNLQPQPPHIQGCSRWGFIDLRVPGRGSPVPQRCLLARAPCCGEQGGPLGNSLLPASSWRKAMVNQALGSSGEPGGMHPWGDPNRPRPGFPAGLPGGLSAWPLPGCLHLQAPHPWPTLGRPPSGCTCVLSEPVFSVTE